jgi:hypothetical protein
MTVTAVLIVNNEIAEESDNVIAAFVGSECRSVATAPMLINGQQMYYLMVYSNSSGETVEFKTYYQPLDSILNNSNSLTFNINASHGTPDSPYEFQANYTVGIELDEILYKNDFCLHKNYPNPFNSLTTISYEIPRSDRVILKVFDLKGSCIEELVNDYQEAGIHQLHWDASGYSSGVYYYLLQTSDGVLMGRCIYLK